MHEVGFLFFFSFFRLMTFIVPFPRQHGAISTAIIQRDLAKRANSRLLFAVLGLPADYLDCYYKNFLIQTETVPVRCIFHKLIRMDGLDFAFSPLEFVSECNFANFVCWTMKYLLQYISFYLEIL